MPSMTTNARPAKSRLLARNAASRETGESIRPGTWRRSARQAMRATPPSMITSRNESSQGPIVDWVKACTEFTTPERVRKVPRIVSANVAMTSDRFQTRSIAAALLHHHRVDERGGGEPGHERRVLHRVPTPVAAPAEHLVAPPRAEDDPDGEEAPRDQRRPADVGEPPLAETAGDERRDRERERDGHADVPEVEHRRVERHERVVLEQRVRARPSRGVIPGTSVNGFAATAMKHEEEQRHAEPDDHRPPDHRVLEAGAEAVGDEREVAGEQQRPEQDRAFERRPQPRDREQHGVDRALFSATYLIVKS